MTLDDAIFYAVCLFGMACIGFSAWRAFRRPPPRIPFQPIQRLPSSRVTVPPPRE